MPVDRGRSSAIALVASAPGWFAAARRHPGRTAAVVGVALVVIALPVGLVPGLADLHPDGARRAAARRREGVHAPPPSAIPTAPAPSVARSVPPTAPPTVSPDAGRRRSQPATLASGEFERHRRLPLRPRHGLDHRDRARSLPPAARGLLGPQRARPVRLPVTRSRRVRGRCAGARDAQGDRRLVRLRPAGRHRPGRLPERDHLVQAVQPPVRDGDVRRT